MSQQEHICKNCGYSFIGNHCSNCGQKIAHRLDTKHIVHEAVHVFTHADKGLFALIPMVLFRPGILALEYIEGKRKRYFNIFQYLVFVVGISVFIMSKTDFMDTVVQTVNPDISKASARVQAVQNQWMNVLRQYMNLFLFALIPVFSFFSWLFFRSKTYNYAENLVLQAATQAQINTYSIFLTLPLVFLTGKTYRGLVFLLSIVVMLSCFTVANRQFFKVSTMQAFFKGLLIYICTNLVQVILIMAAVFILILQYKK